MARPTRDLVDLALGGTLDIQLRQWREWGLSFEAIAERLREDGIAVSRETVRRWIRELEVQR
jgi:transposase-like protein